MKFTSVILLTGLTAGLVYWQRDLFLPGEEAAAAEQALLFPGFADRINDVERVEIESGDGAFTLARQESDWGLAEKDGYPADGKKLLKLLVAMGDAQLLEQKTSNAELYARLGVEEPAEGSEATRVTIHGQDGEIASLIVGNQRQAKGGSAHEAFYVRRAGEPTSWLVEADLDVAATEADWLDRDILDLASDEVQAVEIVHADGERVYAVKPDDTATDMELDAIPDGQELRYASVANSLATGLQRTQMDDVVARGTVAFENPPQATATFWTFDGLRYTIRTQLEDEKLYAEIDVAYSAEAPPGVAPKADAPAEDGEANEETGDASKDEGPSPEELGARADELNARFGAWTYVLPSWKKSTFQKRMTDLVKDIVPPAEEGDTPEMLGPPIPVPEPGGDGANLPTGDGLNLPAGDGPAVPVTEGSTGEAATDSAPDSAADSATDSATGADAGAGDPEAPAGEPSADPEAPAAGGDATSEPPADGAESTDGTSAEEGDTGAGQELDAGDSPTTEPPAGETPANDPPAKDPGGAGGETTGGEGGGH